MREYFHDESLEKLQEYLDGKEGSSTLELYANNLFIWHTSQYVNSVLNLNEYSLDQIGAAANYARAIIEINSQQAKSYGGGATLPSKAAVYLSIIALTNSSAITGEAGRLLIEGLDTSFLGMRKNEDDQRGETYRHFWFSMHLLGKAREETIDISNYSHTKDISPYQSVLDN